MICCSKNIYDYFHYLLRHPGIDQTSVSVMLSYRIKNIIHLSQSIFMHIYNVFITVELIIIINKMLFVFLHFVISHYSVCYRIL